MRLVGTVRGFAVYDVLYFFGDDEKASWKSILVRTQPGQYREIWHYQLNEGEIWPSYLVKVGQETLFGLEDDCYKQDTIQQYYWFGADSPVRVDLNPIWEAAKKAVPKDTAVWGGYDGRVDFPAGRMQVGLITEPDWHCCNRGTVDVEFKLRSGNPVVTKTSFNPEAEFKWRGCR